MPVVIGVLACLLLVFVAVLALVTHSRKKASRAEAKELLQSLFEESGGWIEIADEAFQPLFQGKVFRVTSDQYALATGVIVERNANPQFLKDLKASRSVQYVGEGRILVKCAIDLGSHVVLTALTDEELVAQLKGHSDPNEEIDVRILLNSAEVQFVNSPEDEESFAEIWERGANRRGNPSDADKNEEGSGG